MGYKDKLLRIRLNRFLIIGAGNTAISFTMLNLAVSVLHQNRVVAIILATSCAIVFSFVFNRSFVFRDRSEPAKKFVRFTAIAATGTLLIQTSIYTVSLYLLSRQGWIGNSIFQVNISNLIASICVMVWNYNGYRLLVFKNYSQVESEYAELQATDETI